MTSLTPARSRTSQRRRNVCRGERMTVTQAHEHHSETLLTNYAFDGARADLSKSLSMNPMFQVTHSFHLGSQTSPPTYHFGAMFANDKVRGPPAENTLPLVQPAYFVLRRSCTVTSTTTATCQDGSTRAGARTTSQKHRRRYVVPPISRNSDTSASGSDGHVRSCRHNRGRASCSSSTTTRAATTR